MRAGHPDCYRSDIQFKQDISIIEAKYNIANSIVEFFGKVPDYKLFSLTKFQLIHELKLKIASNCVRVRVLNLTNLNLRLHIFFAQFCYCCFSMMCFCG